MRDRLPDVHFEQLARLKGWACRPGTPKAPSLMGANVRKLGPPHRSKPFAWPAVDRVIGRRR